MRKVVKAQESVWKKSSGAVLEMYEENEEEKKDEREREGSFYVWRQQGGA